MKAKVLRTTTEIRGTIDQSVIIVHKNKDGSPHFTVVKGKSRDVITILNAKSTLSSQIRAKLVSNESKTGQRFVKPRRSSLQDRQGPRHAPSPHSQKLDNRVRALIRSGRRVKVRELALHIGISKSVIHKIFSQLTDAHKLHCQQMLQTPLKRFVGGHAAIVGPEGDGGLDTELESFLEYLIGEVVMKNGSIAIRNNSRIQ
ncbi:hypothetical protein ElyMa_001079600 [Elysia marginata]|uniref:HTH iclR-type domain-containing protein n=1 Tax=Elysia marginata TaxID=1093978 RepID=A0AAV4HRG4_9GAST|nr:hypothetical protein ElyMa_001079600 [Elysia marginata]